jgi:hypothetical protein
MRAVRAERKTLMALQAFLKPGGSLFLFRTGSMVHEADLVTPPLSWHASHSLVAASDSRLAVFVKSQLD